MNCVSVLNTVEFVLVITEYVAVKLVGSSEFPHSFYPTCRGLLMLKQRQRVHPHRLSVKIPVSEFSSRTYDLENN